MSSTHKPVGKKKASAQSENSAKKASLTTQVEQTKPAKPQKQKTTVKPATAHKSKRTAAVIDSTSPQAKAKVVNETWCPDECPELVFRCEKVADTMCLLASYAGSRVFKSSLLAGQATGFNLKEPYSNNSILTCSVARDEELEHGFKLVKLKHPNGLIENECFLVQPRFNHS